MFGEVWNGQLRVYPQVANDTCRATSLKVGIGHRGSPGAQWGWAMGIVLVGVVVVL